MKVYYLVYKILNLINGNSYVGAHQTTRKDDNYMSSSRVVRFAIKKHGISNFKKTILWEGNSLQEMFAKEKELVVVGPMSYNLKPGGLGGGKAFHTKETRMKMSKTATGVKKSPDHIRSMSECRKGKPLSDSRRRALSESKSLRKHINQLGASRSYTYQVISPTGETQIITGMTAFCKNHGLYQGNMCAVARGKVKHCKGWTCKKL